MKTQKTEIKREFEEFSVLPSEDFEQLPTPIYDAKGNEVKKYFAIGGAKYIEELGEALRQDWAKDVSMDYWKDGTKSNRARLLMRRKLVNDWSNEHGNSTPWKENTVIEYLPEFLKYPAAVKEAHKESKLEMARIHLEKANQARAEKYRQKVQSEFKTIGRIVTQSAEPPKEPEPEVITGGYSMGPSKYQKLGEDTKTPLTKLGNIREYCRELWTALTDKENMPYPDEDLADMYIKPTREFRKFIYELDERERSGLDDWLACTEAAIIDMRDILEAAKTK
jgi:hypothetical protein